VRGCFVTGTGTGVGKTVVAAAMCAALIGRGERAVPFKPVVTGTDEGPPPHDHELLAAAAGGVDPAAVAPLVLGPAAAPHLAAEVTGTRIEPPALLDAARRAGELAEALIVEGVGGILVPLTPGYLVRDLARDLGLPVVVAARPGLGTINHTLLTLEAARAVGLPMAGVALTPWPDEPDPLERSNRDTIAGLGRVDVATLPPVDPTDTRALARAGESLPLDAWLAGPTP
jgi:dethiobiotin synthetase